MNTDNQEWRVGLFLRVTQYPWGLEFEVVQAKELH